MAENIQDVSKYAISAEAKSLAELLERTLDRVVGLFERHGVPLPSRQYWMLGATPAEDCEQVVVSYLQGYLGVPGDQAAEAQRCNAPKTAVMNVFITRNAAVGTNGRVPTPDNIMKGSVWPAIDNWVLLDGLEDITAGEDGFAGSGVIATVSTSTPSGGVQTTVLNLSMVIP